MDDWAVWLNGGGEQRVTGAPRSACLVLQRMRAQNVVMLMVDEMTNGRGLLLPEDRLPGSAWAVGHVDDVLCPRGEAEKAGWPSLKLAFRSRLWKVSVGPAPYVSATCSERGAMKT